ncbi:MAG TPA: rhodanese-like domain-containing protein [Lacipirellula sp.]
MLPLEITPQDVHALRAAGDDFLLLDCREPEEHAVAAIAGARLVPMGELPQRVGELRDYRDRPVVVYCHLGGRSLRAAHWLRQQGFEQAQSMAGGIDEWAVEIEPGMPRY